LAWLVADAFTTEKANNENNQTYHFHRNPALVFSEN
jgi:hypothetical protein